MGLWEYLANQSIFVTLEKETDKKLQFFGLVGELDLDLFWNTDYPDPVLSWYSSSPFHFTERVIQSHNLTVNNHRIW